jgi:hypothetical protein
MKSIRIAAASAALLMVLGPRPARAHCDTLDGPVVTDARAALGAGEVTPVLKWVSAEKEGEVRQAFVQAVAVRGLGPEARALADQFFFETLVRIHREGEGAPYTGLKPAGTETEPGIAAADRALHAGSVEELATQAGAAVEQGLRHRFADVIEKKKHAGHDVASGRAYVAAYVEFVHYAERVMAAAAGPAAHAPRTDAPPAHVH